MKLRLKARELQKKLDEISGGCFTEALESVKKPNCLIFQARNGGPAMSIMLTSQDIEPFSKYNPKDWNNYPDVTPPEGVLMRVEFIYDGILRRNCAIFENGAWYIAADRKALYDFTIDNVKRYRPWE